MNWAWANSIDQIWHSPEFPVWLTLAAAGFFGLIVLITLLRAEKSVANGALTVITLLAVGIAVAATILGLGSGSGITAVSKPQPPMISASAPLSCVDDLAGDVVLTACEKTVFGSADSTAAAVSYAAWQITRLTALGDVAAANNNMTPELHALRHAVEQDRYGLIAHVLTVRDNCTPSDCTAFRAMADRHQVVANMEERLYETTIARYAPTWTVPPVQPAAPLTATLVPGVPTGRPTNADFPSAASTPPVSIMTPEPATSTSTVSRATAPAANAPSPAPKPIPAAASSTPAANAPSPRPAPAASPTLAAAKKQPAPKPSRTPTPAAPVSIAPTAPAPAASNE